MRANGVEKLEPTPRSVSVLTVVHDVVGRAIQRYGHYDAREGSQLLGRYPW
jgi:hypothetical protein